MPALPALSGKEVVRLFEKEGWEKVRQRGSHMILIKPGEMASLFPIIKKWPKAL